ncbi:TonB-dependent receptor [Massilia terrae]|uniref:TonB-dependent receptor n=1 Tax=Massilia terrae TaxID=1811224 RepID=A0ABT2CUX5_9BURK|nr:TonB-dependent receptor [Massilia terrae]MCS0657782.1 TonB-dependent receptor [Massilia terrae]
MKQYIRHPGSRLALTSVALAVLTLTNPAFAQAQDGQEKMERVTVTGSSIKRIATENALPLTTYKAEELEAQGLTTMSEVAVSLVTASTNEPVGGGGSGTMINMRGLNSNRTLVLLNGRRLPNESIGDATVNVDVIPMSAIDRVEVLRDGASSIYGTDAIAGVVNFITKRTYTGVKLIASDVKPERKGGGEQPRASIIAGKGELQKDGWNVYTALDVQKRHSLMQKDRPEIWDPATIVALGGTQFTTNTSGSSASPANFTVYNNGKATSTTGNPYWATGCTSNYASQYSLASTKSKNTTCVLDPTIYPQLLPEAAQSTLLTKASLRHGEDGVLSVEMLNTVSYIDALNPPQTFGANVDYSALNPGVRLPLMITKSSKWYPGNAGGVPAVSGVTGQDLALTWSMDEAGPAITDDRQHTNRIVVNDEGLVAGWDYRLGLNVSQSRRDVGWKSNFFSTPGIYQGVANGTLNPFGVQDSAGKTYLDSIREDGKTYRSAKVKYYGADFNLSRSLYELPGGSLALAFGGDLHRESYRDNTDMVADLVTYKVSGSPGASAGGGRNVGALYAEVDAPVTKTLDLTGAVRVDRFSDFGSTVNPKISARWEASKKVMLRATASTGFRAPTLPELYGTPRVLTPSTNRWDDPLLCPSATPSVPNTGTLNPKYANLNLDPATVCNTRLTTLTGANPNLQPEKSKTFTAGIVIEPIKNSMVSFDFWDVRMKGTIAQMTEDTIFSNPAKYANLFVRNPDGTLQYIDVSRMNLGGLHTQGIDVGANYVYPTATMGKFGVALDGTYVRKYETQTESGGAWNDSVGQPGALATGGTSSNTYVFRWKSNLRFSWSYKDFGAQLTQSYTSHYIDTNALPTQQPGQPFYNVISPYKIYNLSTNYKFSKNFRLSFGVNNLRDVNPPLSNQRLSSRVVFARNIAKPIGRTYVLKGEYTF